MSRPKPPRLGTPESLDHGWDHKRIQVRYIRPLDRWRVTDCRFRVPWRVTDSRRNYWGNLSYHPTWEDAIRHVEKITTPGWWDFDPDAWRYPIAV